MTDIRNHLSDQMLTLADETAMPGPFEPMLATLTDQAFSDDRWIFERKFAGTRLLAFRDGDYVELRTRNGESCEKRFPELVAALCRQPCRRFVLDGEVVALDDDVFFYAFDCPWVGGFDLRRVPLRDRKRLLRAAVTFSDPLRYTSHRDAEGEALLAEAVDKGWAGILAKRADSVYRRGRSRRWLKLRCLKEQALVIGGFTDPASAGMGFGALLVGYYEGQRLHYAARVDAGLDQAAVTRMHRQLLAIERGESPFVDAMDEPGVHWVAPERVAAIAFSEWTADGRLGAPRFIGEREDKPASEVVRERAQY